MTVSKSRLATGLRVALHEGASSLPGTGGASVANWAIDGDWPRDALITFKNNAAVAVTISAASLLASDGARKTDMGILFDGYSVSVPAGECVSCPARRDAAAFGQTWSVKATLTPDSSTANVTVTAEPLYTQGA